MDLRSRRPAVWTTTVVLAIGKGNVLLSLRWRVPLTIALTLALLLAQVPHVAFAAPSLTLSASCGPAAPASATVTAAAAGFGASQPVIYELLSPANAVIFGGVQTTLTSGGFSVIFDVQQAAGIYTFRTAQDLNGNRSFDAGEPVATATFTVPCAAGGGGDATPAPHAARLYALMNSTDSFHGGTPASSIEIVSLTTMATLGTIALGARAVASLAVSPDRQRAYVADTTNNAVAVIDLVSGVQIATLTAPAPRDVVLDATGATLYVTTNGKLLAFSTATNAQVRQLLSQTTAGGTTPDTLLSVALSPGGGTVATIGHDGSGSWVYLVNAATFSLLSRFLLTNPGEPSNCATAPNDVAFASETRLLLWDSNCDNLYEVDVPTRAQNTARTIRLGRDDGSSFNYNNALSYSAATGKAFAHTEGGAYGGSLRGHVGVMDTAATTGSGIIGLGGTPFASAITPDGTSHFIAVIRRFDTTGAADVLHRHDVGTSAFHKSVYTFATASQSVRDMRIVADPQPAANLSIAKTLVNPSNLNVFAATEQFYQLTVTNAGPNTATGVTIVDTLPANVTLVQAHPACVNAAGTLTCTLPQGFANLAVGDSFSIFIKVKFNNAGSYTNTASVSADETDPNAANNTSSHTQQVLPTADLFLAMRTATPGVAAPGDTVKYDTTFENLGPDPTGDVVLVQTIPTGSTFVSISSPDTTICGPGANASEFGCRYSAIPAGASRTMTVNIIAPNSPGALVATFTASHVVPPLILDPPSGQPSSATFQHWVVFESVQQSVASSGTATTDTENDGATSNDPIETTVSGTAGTVTITEQKQGSTAPTNWSIIAVDVVISAPAGTTTSPLFLTFRIDTSFLGQFTAQTIQVFRNNDFVNPVPACQQPVWPTMPSSTVPISPDPCVWKRSTLSDGDVEITVLSSQASVWNFAVHKPFEFGGFEPPMGTTRRAGSTLPVKFRLFDQNGEVVTPAQLMNVLAPNSPSSRQVSCETGVTLSDELPIRVIGGGLHFDSETNTYSINWKTEKAWAGTCRELLLELIDGSVQRTRLIFE